MNIFEKLKVDLRNTDVTIAALNAEDKKKLWDKAVIEVPKDPLNGDISTNIALLIGSKLSCNAREVAIAFKKEFEKIPYIAHIEIAGAGFINFTIKAETWHSCIKSIIADDRDFWDVNIGNNQKVNIEYASANPTGPMHVGHSRGAIYGDVLANILSKCGYDVTKEYYINDEGGQIDILLSSVLLRYKECISGEAISIPDGLYPGDYLKPIGQELYKKHGKSLIELDEQEAKDLIRDYTINAMMDMIKTDLNALGIKHDVFFSEFSLHRDGKIDQIIDRLTEEGYVYEGVLPAPKGIKSEDWKPRKQLLFKASDFGDDQDRVLRKMNGSWSYLAADIAYVYDKISRGFTKLIYSLGADHTGYVKRIQAIVKILGKGEIDCNIEIGQLVHFIKNNKSVKMSKRGGDFFGVSDLVEEVGKDIVRFMMLTRRNDVPFDFDFDKVTEQSKDNPVFYVQYAYVRCVSIISKLEKKDKILYEKFKSGVDDLSFLSTEEEIQLIKLLASWGKNIESAARNAEPQKLAYYLIDIAAAFHAVWNMGHMNEEYRFISENDDMTLARCTLVDAVRKIILRGLEIIGVDAIESM